MSEIAPETPVEAPAPDPAPVDPAPAAPAPADPVGQVEQVVRTIEEAAAELLALVDEGVKIGDRALDAVRDEVRAILHPAA